MDADSISAFAAALSALFALASLIVAALALKNSRKALDSQQSTASEQLRPWVVMRDPCILTRPLSVGHPVRFRQNIEVIGSRPATRMRVQSWWTLIKAEEALQHFGIEKQKVNRRLGEGTLFALAPNQKHFIFESSDSASLTRDQLELIDAGTHAIRVVMVVEYESSSSPGTLFRSTAAVLCRNANIHARGDDLILNPTMDGFHVE
ncbi:MAG: hypothetical protein RR698_00650 [Stenotrophomonas sp.]